MLNCILKHMVAVMMMTHMTLQMTKYIFPSLVTKPFFEVPKYFHVAATEVITHIFSLLVDGDAKYS